MPLVTGDHVASPRLYYTREKKCDHDDNFLPYDGYTSCSHILEELTTVITIYEWAHEHLEDVHAASQLSGLNKEPRIASR